MKKYISGCLMCVILIYVVGAVSSCAGSKAADESATGNDIIPQSRVVAEEVKSYWYDGKAEISSYQLTQARYGETHTGTAILVYVAEPFSKSSNTKADNESDSNIPVLKLNNTRKFTTGIYPYSMMSSTFFPLEKGNASLKIASSLQEWCGMTYLQMKNDKQFIFDFDSYFEGLSFQGKKVEKKLLEDDLWSLIRLNPELLPVGEYEVIPSMFFLRLRSKEVNLYKATINLSTDDNGVTHYKLEYPALDRTITIQFKTAFPNTVLEWSDVHYSGTGDEKKMLTTTGKLLKTIKTDYWNQNLNRHTQKRKELGF